MIRLSAKASNLTPTPCDTSPAAAPSFLGPDLASSIVEPSTTQSFAIPDALTGRGICGKAVTGFGKTLAFGLPPIQRMSRQASVTPAVLVLVPTQELAAQVSAALESMATGSNLRVVAILGDTPAQRLRAGVDIVVATPGCLSDQVDRGAVSIADVTRVAVDEAGHMADMGFFPRVRRILNAIRTPHQTILFSATRDGDIDRIVRQYQHSPVFHDLPGAGVGEVATIRHRFVAVRRAEKIAVAAAITRGRGRSLFFVRTHRGVDSLARKLQERGVKAGRLHGRLSQPERDRALQAFANRQAPVLVVTEVAARSIHVDAVDIVVHYDIPDDSKTYLNHSETTARAGAAGVVVTLVDPLERAAVADLQRKANMYEPVEPMGPSDSRLPTLNGRPLLDEPIQLELGAMRDAEPTPSRGQAGGEGNAAELRPCAARQRTPVTAWA